MKYLLGVIIVMMIITTQVTSVVGATPPDPGSAGPYAVAYTVVILTNPDSGSELTTEIYYPASGGVLDTSEAPFPALVFAPGFLSPTGTYAGNVEHLASWGYVVATIPDFPPVETEALVSDIRFLVSYLEAVNADEDSQFFKSIDVKRFGVVGHSRGGMATLMAAGRDARIKAVISLDPSTGDWDHELEVPPISIPTAIIAAPPQYCNGDGSYDDIYALMTAAHRAKYVIANASHCDFMDTDDVIKRIGCLLVCGGSYNDERVKLSNRYTTAWFNYYLQDDPDYFTYIYGAEAEQDVLAERITLDMQTATKGVQASPIPGTIELNWEPTHYPVVAGYSLYRSLNSGDHSDFAYVQLGREAVYTDTLVWPNRRYHYVLRSRDAAGNLHMASSDIFADTLDGQPPPECRFSDINADGIIDLDDIIAVLANSIFKGIPYGARYDLVPDGVIDIADIFEVAALFGQSCL